MRPSLKLPRTVWILGIVSLLMDLSSEIYHALLPAFLTVTLGLPVVAMGAIDGIAEGTANIAKLVSGRLSDRQQRRKPWILLGYGLAAFSKPLFPLAQGALPVMGARFALEPGPTAVPTRSTLIGAATSVVLVAATVTFAAGLDHFVDTPDLYGTTWSHVLSVDTPSDLVDPDPGPVADQLAADERVEAFSMVVPGQVTLDGRSVPALALANADSPRPFDGAQARPFDGAQGRPARTGGDDVVKQVKRDEPKLGRNDPCFCGSGKKYKKCHGAA